MSKASRTFMAVIATAASLCVVAPGMTSAQGRGHENDKSHRNDKHDNDKGNDNDKGPSFCRSGAGHPQFGRQWCIDKGFGLGNPHWSNPGWGDVIFGRNTRRSGSINNRILTDVLGRTTYNRLLADARQVGGGTLNGRWITNTNGPLLLEVQAGSHPLAEFVDRNRDGRVDYVLLNRER